MAPQTYIEAIAFLFADELVSASWISIFLAAPKSLMFPRALDRKDIEQDCVKLDPVAPEGTVFWPRIFPIFLPIIFTLGSQFFLPNNPA